MLHTQRALLLALGVAFGACRAAPQPGAGTDSPISGFESLQRSSGRPLQGRFLHVTDFHPDPFYKTYSSTEADAACHRKRGPAGVYGGETSGCDSPISLVNETFKWINENLRDSIDFIIWTGDSARHDNDERLPRTQKQVIVQNELLVTKFTEVFGTSNKNDDANAQHDLEIPIVPTFGNNDIMPHNIFLSGPNKWTSKYLDIWKNFIPEAQRHQFQQGGWFYVEVIPGKLAVISLNTLYFFDSNSGVDGCADKHEPGYEHMEWLRIQLTILRERGIKAMLMGHVPPARTSTKASWDETCWQKYALIEQNFRDIIVGSFYGHMNIDHFMIQDFKDIKKSTKKGRMANGATFQLSGVRESMLEDGEITVASATDYLLSLGNAWAKLPSPPNGKKNSKPNSITDYIDADEEDDVSFWQWVMHKISRSRRSKKGGKGDKDGKDDKDGPSKKKRYLEKIGGRYAERFSVAHVSPSVVPNYFPTLRIFEYNTTGLENTLSRPIQSLPLDRTSAPAGQLPIEYSNFSDDDDWIQDVKALVDMKKRKKAHEAITKKPKKYKFKVPPPPDKSAPPGPAYSPQTFTLKGYAQYFANLTHINNDFVAQTQPPFRPLAESEYDNTTIFGLEVEDRQIEPNRWKEGKHKNHQGKKPKNKPHPKKFKFEMEYNTTHDKLFKLKDLTVRSYVDLARRIGRDKNGKKVFNVDEQEYEYEEEEEEEEIYDEAEEKGTESHDEEPDDKLDMEKKDRRRREENHHKKHKHAGPWYTFVRRAFVSTMDPHEIEEAFGQGSVLEEVEEIMEL